MPAGCGREHVVNPAAELRSAQRRDGSEVLSCSVPGGFAVFDYDNDGILDLFFANGGELPSAARRSRNIAIFFFATKDRCSSKTLPAKQVSMAQSIPSVRLLLTTMATAFLTCL